MSKTMLMTNEEVMLAAGITAEEIAAVKTSDQTVKVNTLSAIYGKLMAFVYEQRIEWANLRNPLAALEKGYASMNGGSLNGFFSETLIRTRDKGTNGLYGGTPYIPGGALKNPYTDVDYGKAPIQYVFGINAKLQRDLNYDAPDLVMNLKEYSLISFIDGKLATIDAENNASVFAIENNVLNCERFQYKNYADCEVFTDAYSLNEFMHEVMISQKYPEDNTQFKRVPFNTTRQERNFVIILDEQFAFKFAERFQYKQYLKPFIFRSEDSDRYGVQEERSNILMVNRLTPTTLASGEILDPLNMTAATLPEGVKLIGRIVDFAAVKFGMGLKTSVNKNLNSRTFWYNEIQDYCFDMSDAYVNVPLLINETTFKADRIIHVQQEPAPTARTATK